MSDIEIDNTRIYMDYPLYYNEKTGKRELRMPILLPEAVRMSIDGDDTLATALAETAQAIENAFITIRDAKDEVQARIDSLREAGSDKAAELEAEMAEVGGRLTALQNAVADSGAKIQLMYDSLYSDVTANPFLITFGNLDGVVLKSGVWNEKLQRIEW